MENMSVIDSEKQIAADPSPSSEDKEKSSSTKSTSTLLNAMQFFGKMAGKLNSDKSTNQQNQDSEDNGSSSKKEPLDTEPVIGEEPSQLVEAAQPSQHDQPKTEELLNLAFLTQQEKNLIHKVIQADLKLRRNILGSLRKRIDGAQQSQTEETVTTEQSQSCVVCGQEVSTICTRVFAVKCSDCGRVVCKKCANKQVHELSTICLSCKKRRNLQLQTLDYESILNYGIHDNNGGVESIPVSAESELIKKSLQAIPRPQATVELANGSQRETVPGAEMEDSLIHPKSNPEQPSSALPIPDSSHRPKSALSGDSTVSVPRIGDTDCGFVMMTQANDESLVDLCSVYSEQCYFDVEIKGRIQLAVWYRCEESRLYIRIVKAENLVEAADGSLNPYVKTYLLPGIYKSNKRKTGIQNGSKKLAWNELLKYAGLSQEEVKTRTLWVSVWDWNRYGRQQFLGEVCIPLNGRDLTNSENQWFQLRDSENKPSIETEEVDSPEQQAKPRVLFVLKFAPYTSEVLANLRSDKEGRLGCLQVKIRRAENLPSMDVNDRTDSLARCYLLPNRQVGGKKKTQVVQNSLNPVWEEEMVYTYVSLEELQAERALEVTLWDFDRRGTNQFIGGVRIGPNPFDVIDTFDWMDSKESESNHWDDMIDNPGEWVEAWHTLRPSMDSLHTLQKNTAKAGLSSESLPIETSGKDSNTPLISTPVSTSQTDQSLEVNISRPGKGHYQISGEVLIGIKYKDGSLYVKVVKAAGLTAVHRNGTSNPYIKVYLLPDRSKECKKKTDVKKKTVNPVYKEAFIYQVSEADIQMRTLWVTVWNHDSIGANLFMGETCISLAGNLRHSVERWYELHDFAECGMVVMATPFGHTPQKHPDLQPGSEPDHEHLDHSEEDHGEKGEDVPDTPPQETVDISEVKVDTDKPEK